MKKRGIAKDATPLFFITVGYLENALLLPKDLSMCHRMNVLLQKHLSRFPISVGHRQHC